MRLEGGENTVVSGRHVCESTESETTDHHSSPNNCFVFDYWITVGNVKKKKRKENCHKVTSDGLQRDYLV